MGLALFLGIIHVHVCIYCRSINHFCDSEIFISSFSVYADGSVCISILHTPGDDPLGYETAAERWSPVQSIEKILLSVISMLAG